MKSIKKLIVLCILCLFVLCINTISVKAYTDPNTVLREMSTKINIEVGQYDSYTNSDYGLSGEFAIEDYMSGKKFGRNMLYIEPQTPDSPKRAIVKGDDPIISFVPKELFKNYGEYGTAEYTYIGKEYGFHVTTERAPTNYSLEYSYDGHISIVSVFIFDIDSNLTYKNNIIDSQKIYYEVEPIGVYHFIYYSNYVCELMGQYSEGFTPFVIRNVKNLNYRSQIFSVNFQFENYNEHKNNGVVVPYAEIVDFDNRIKDQFVPGYTNLQDIYPIDYDNSVGDASEYAVSDFGLLSEWSNENNLNIHDENYNIDNDKGYFFEKTYVEYMGKVNSPIVEKSYTVSWETFHPLLVGISTIGSFSLNPWISLASKAFLKIDGYLSMYNELKPILSGENSQETSPVYLEENRLLGILNNENPTLRERGGTIESQKNWCADTSNTYYDPNSYEYIDYFSTLGYHLWRYDFRKVGEYQSNDYIGSILYNATGFVTESEDDDCFIRFVQNISRQSTGINDPENIQSRYTYNPYIKIVKKVYGNEYSYCGEATACYYELFGSKVDKSISIETSLSVYSQRNGYEKVVFKPFASSIYQISLSNSSLYITFNSDPTKYKGTFDILLKEGITYNIFVRNDTEIKTGNMANIKIIPKELDLGNHYINDVMTYKSSERILFKYSSMKTDLLHLNLSISNLYFYPKDSISIVDKNGNKVVQLHNDFGYASNVNNSNEIIYPVKSGEIYYILIQVPKDYIDNENTYIDLSQGIDTLTLDNENVLYNSGQKTTQFGDELFKFKVPVAGNYEAHFYRDSSDSPNFVVFTINSDSSITILGGNIDNNRKAIVTGVNMYLNPNQEVYIGYVNSISLQTSYKILITKLNGAPLDIPEYELSVDPTWASIKGTEFTVRNNSNITEIGIGFTRCLYIVSNSEYSNISRLCFNYYSSNNSFASVSSYGTVTAYGLGTVTITAVPKPGYGLVANTTIEFTIVDSGSGRVSLTTDMNIPGSGSQNGTQLLIGGLPGGNIVNRGYTRSLCIVLGPSSYRQDYIWMTSNSSVAKVNSWGYVEGVTAGVVTITCIFKLNNQWIGEYEIRVQ